MKNAMIGAGVALALWMVPEAATACGSYNMANLCGTVEWTENVDLGDDVVGLVVHGGFASAQQFSFDGLDAEMQAGHGKTILLCGVDEDWCLDTMQAILDAEVRGGFLYVNAWDGFNAPSTEGLPMGVWADDVVFSESMFEGKEGINGGMPVLNLWGESFTNMDMENAASNELCRAAASIGSGIHPGEPVIDFSPSIVRVDTDVDTFEPGVETFVLVTPPAPAAEERDQGFVFDTSVDVDVESLRVLTGELNTSDESAMPQAGCSVTSGGSSAVSMLGGAAMFFVLGLLRRREAQVH